MSESDEQSARTVSRLKDTDLFRAGLAYEQASTWAGNIRRCKGQIDH